MEPDATAKRIVFEKLPSGGFIRAHPRYRISLPAEAQVSASDMTITPFRMRGQTVDLSKGGLQVRVDAMPSGILERVRHENRFLWIAFVDPFANRAIKLFAKIMWVEYEPAVESEDHRRCRIGISFEGIQNEETLLAEYAGLLDHIESGLRQREPGDGGPA